MLKIGHCPEARENRTYNSLTMLSTSLPDAGKVKSSQKGDDDAVVWRKKKQNVSIPPGYIHDWEPGIIKKYFPYRRPYSGGRNLTTLLPISDAKYVAEIG